MGRISREFCGLGEDFVKGLREGARIPYRAKNFKGVRPVARKRTVFKITTKADAVARKLNSQAKSFTRKLSKKV